MAFRRKGCIYQHGILFQNIASFFVHNSPAIGKSRRHTHRVCAVAYIVEANGVVRTVEINCWCERNIALHSSKRTGSGDNDFAIVRCEMERARS